MKKINLNDNMGFYDRLIRGILGIFLIVQGCQSDNSRKKGLLMLIGMWLTIPSLTGSDPIFQEFNISSKEGDRNHLINLFKKRKPGYSIKPLLTQNAWPTAKAKAISFRKTLAQALAIK